MRSRAQKTDHHQLPHTGFPRSFNDVMRAFNVNALVSLPTTFTIDTGAMHDGIAPGKSRGKRSRVLQTNRKKSGVWKLKNCRVGFVNPAGHKHDFMSITAERARDVTTDKPRAPCNCNSHGWPPFHAAHA
jgi:hypothetical protein